MRNLDPLVVFTPNELSLMFGIDKNSSPELPCDDTPLWPLIMEEEGPFDNSRQLWGGELPSEEELQRQENLLKYIDRGYAFEPPDGIELVPLEDFLGVSACPNCGESVEGCDYCQIN